MGSTPAQRAPAAAKSSQGPAPASRPAVSAEPATAERQGGGRPLPPTTRERMERSFGRSFADVRVHEGSEAAASARGQGAEAFTQGNHITFGEGRYQPGSEAGERLLAHELAHVVQQQGGSAAGPQKKSEVSTPAEPAEQEAEAAAARVVRGEPAGVRPGGHGSSTRERLMRRALAGAGPALTVPAPVTGLDVGAVDTGAESAPLAPVAPRRRRREAPVPGAAAPTEAERARQAPEEGAPEAEAEREPGSEEQAASAPQAEERSAASRARAGMPEERRRAAPAPVSPEPARKAEARTEPASGEAPATAAPKAEEKAPAPAKGKESAPAEPRGAMGLVRGVGPGAGPRKRGLAEALAGGGAEGKKGARKEAAAPLAMPTAAPAAEAPAPQGGGGPLPGMGAEAVAGGAAPVASAAPAAAPEAAGGGAAAGGVGAEVGGVSAESAEADTEARMKAAQPEEEAAAEEVQEGGGGGPEAEEAPAPEETGGAEALAEPGAEGAPSAAPTSEDLSAPPESDEERQAREAESAPFAEEGPASPEAASPEEASLGPGEQQVALDSLRESVGGGGEGGGGGGGGGAIADKPTPEVPDVSQAAPAEALGQVAHLPPAQLSQALTGVGQAVTHSVGEKRETLAAQPPELETPTGMPGRAGGSAVDRGAEPSAGGQKAEKVAAGENQPQPQPTPTPEPPPPLAVSVAAPALQGGPQGEMSSEDAAQLGASIQRLPTADPELSTSAGPAPTLALEGGADPAQVEAQRAKVDERVAEAQAQGREEVAQPRGEDEIAPEAAEGTLRAKVGAGGGAGASVGGGAEADEAVSLVAQQEHGEEVSAAVQQGQGDMASEESRHAEEEAQERQRTEEEAERQQQAAEEEQRGEKARARGEVDAQRAEWSEAQRSAVEDGRTQADAKGEEARTSVQREKERADTEASEHLEDGEREATREKREGEAEAERHKARAESEGGGFFGWLASKAKAFFDSIKKGIQAAIKKAREAVKRAIDTAKRLAAAAIEKARQLAVAAIRAAGDALIAIGDTVLAAFPEARARFRRSIEEKVRAAEDAVNRIADALQKGVQALLDALGDFLDKALGLLEAGLLAIVDAVNAAVQGAIKAAKAAVDALGTFAQLIRDIAANPGQWIANLGAAVVDGIRNHLWKALKSAVSEWFNQKLEAVLGLGTTLLNLLFKGGLSLAAIGKMAFEALKSAIPTVLVQLLIEKLVSLIVPAAGAVMAIVEGLQAAWGTVSRILAAVDRFITFLKAVKGGGAGPQFASAAAAGAVAVIEFVANWLIARLRRPAGAVAGRLRAIGQRILAKLKKALKKVGKALKKAWRKVKGRVKKLFKGKKRGRGDKKKDKRARADEILAKAQRELAPKINALISRRPSGLRLRAQLMGWRVMYRLRALDVKRGGGQVHIIARVNPEAELAAGYSFTVPELLKMLEDVANEFFRKHMRRNTKEGKAAHEADIQRMEKDAKANPEAIQPSKTQTSTGVFQPSRPMDDLRLAARASDRTKRAHDVFHGPKAGTEAGGVSAQTRQQAGGGRFMESVDQKTGEAAGGLDYDEIVGNLKGAGLGPEDVGFALESLRTGKGIPAEFRGQERSLSQLKNLMFNVEVQRERRNLVFSAMTSDLLTSGDIKLEEAFGRAPGVGEHPATMQHAAVGFSKGQGSYVSPFLVRAHGGDVEKARAARTDLQQENQRRQIALLKRWFQAQVAGGNEPVAKDIESLKKFVLAWVENNYQRTGGGGGTGTAG